MTYFVKRPARPPEYATYEKLVGPVNEVLGALAKGGQSSPEEASAAFRAGVDALGWRDARFEFIPEGPIDLLRLDAALQTLDLASRPLKKQVLLACAAVVGADRRVTVEEGELLRTISDSIDCPMPPLLAGAETGA